MGCALIRPTMATWTRRPHRPLTPTTRIFRVEHVADGETRPLGVLTDVAPHHTTLDPFVSALLRDGADGELRLIDAVTGITVARRKVVPYSANAGERFRR
jgi:hypothetical protein